MASNRLLMMCCPRGTRRPGRGGATPPLVRRSACGCGQFGLLTAGDTRHLPGIDQVLAASNVDRLLADAEELRHLGDVPARSDEIEHTTAKLGAAHRQTSLDAKGPTRCPMRTDKLAIAYQAALHLAAIFIWTRR